MHLQLLHKVAAECSQAYPPNRPAPGVLGLVALVALISSVKSFRIHCRRLAHTANAIARRTVQRRELSILSLTATQPIQAGAPMLSRLRHSDAQRCSCSKLGLRLPYRLSKRRWTRSGTSSTRYGTSSTRSSFHIIGISMDSNTIASRDTQTTLRSSDMNRMLSQAGFRLTLDIATTHITG